MTTASFCLPAESAIFHAVRLRPTAAAVAFAAPASPNPLLLGLLEEKPKAMLCHELGAGSPCLKCSDRCAGLDLHYWRKICKNCSCRLDEHDVVLSRELDHGEFVIRKLFDSRPKSSYGAESCRPMSSDDETPWTDDGSARGGQGGIVERLRQIHLNATKNSVALPSADSSLTPALPPPQRAISLSASETYAWLPAGDQKLVDRYMQSLPADERPLLGRPGAQTRRQRLAFQLPYHDCDTNAAKSLQNADEKEKHRTFVDYVKQNVVGVGEICDAGTHAKQTAHANGATPAGGCRTCRKNLTPGDVGVVTEHGSDDIWHVKCFRCEVCYQPLADLLYFFKDNRYYCGRHYGECVYPRCGGCDELIFAREYTFAEERAWHVDHFCCFGCDKHLGGHRYVTKEDNTYCIDCYMQRFARTCAACAQKIAPFDSRISHKDFHWHATAECFKCATCAKSLTNQKFSLHDGRTFCGATCVRAGSSAEAKRRRS